MADAYLTVIKNLQKLTRSDNFCLFKCHSRRTIKILFEAEKSLKHSRFACGHSLGGGVWRGFRGGSEVIMRG